MAVSSPFLAKRFCTVHSARYSVYTLLTVAIILFSSTFPIIYHTDDSSGRKKCRIRPHLGLIHRVYQPIVFYAIPDILLLSNLFTVYSLIRRRKQQAQRLSDADQCEMRISDVHSNRKQRQLTIMLVTVNLAFYLFTSPAMILYIAEYNPPKHIEITKLKRSFVFSQISVIFLQLNNAVSEFEDMHSYLKKIFFRQILYFLPLLVNDFVKPLFKHFMNIQFYFKHFIIDIFFAINIIDLRLIINSIIVDPY